MSNPFMLCIDSCYFILYIIWLPSGLLQEPKKMVRYLDSQVVNTKGHKFTEVKKEDTEDMKKTYINLKPARKYRFH